MTIYVQRDEPGDDKRSNWQPMRDGRFGPLMRMYQPRVEILDGDYSLPVRRSRSQG